MVVLNEFYTLFQLFGKKPSSTLHNYETYQYGEVKPQCELEKYNVIFSSMH